MKKVANYLRAIDDNKKNWKICASKQKVFGSELLICFAQNRSIARNDCEKVCVKAHIFKPLILSPVITIDQASA